MVEKDIKRELKAVFSADVNGYTRLMEADDQHTVKTITEYRKIIIHHIRNRSGRVVDAPGDNILAEFGSALDAVNSAVDIQQNLDRLNRSLPNHLKMDFRIGINLGDVIHKDARIYGDGVNIAARIEQLAPPGGICISRAIYTMLERKIRKRCKDMGTFQLKNVSEPVWIYRVPTKGEGPAVCAEENAENLEIWKPFKILATVALMVLSFGWISYLVFESSNNTDSPAFNEQPLSIAVLPFELLDKDLNHEYISSGITDLIIADLTQYPSIFVISDRCCNKTLTRPMKIQSIAKNLGVRYLLEGSVQVRGPTVRITIWLLDSLTGQYVWAEKYDGNRTDLFLFQDEVALKTTSAIKAIFFTSGSAGHFDRQLITPGTSTETGLRDWTSEQFSMLYQPRSKGV